MKKKKKNIMAHGALSKPILIVAMIVLIGVTALLVAKVRNKAISSSAGYGYYPPAPKPKPSVVLSGRIAGTPATKSTQYYTGGITITPGKSVELKWASTEVTSCSAPWYNPPKGTNTTSGTSVQGPIVSKKQFDITCNSTQGQVKGSFLVTVIN